VAYVSCRIAAGIVAEPVEEPQIIVPGRTLN